MYVCVHVCTCGIAVYEVSYVPDYELVTTSDLHLIVLLSFLCAGQQDLSAG